MPALGKSAAFSLVFTAAASALAAQELLSNPGIEIANAPAGWSLEEFATNPAITGNVNSAASAAFANQEAGGSSGLWLRSFQGQFLGNGAELTNAVLSQTVPGTPGETYTMTGWSQFEGNYSGGVPILDPLSPLGAVLSPTETTFQIEFLDSGDSVVGAPVVLDLRTVQFNGFGWAQHTLNGVAPAGTTNVRVTAQALDMAPNLNPGQSAFFDTFSLTGASSPATELLTNANLEQGADEPPGWVREVGADTQVARYEGFAARTGANGFWIAPRSANAGPEDALFTQTLDAVPNGEYTLSGWSFFEPEYAGGVEMLNPAGPFGPIASDTETYFLISFLDDSGVELETTLLDLRTVQQNDATWREHSLSATAPADAAEVKIGIMAESIRDNRPNPGGQPFDDAYFDDFSLMLAAAPTLPGDADGDGDVDGDDLIAVQTNFGSVSPPPGDADGDGDVDGDDLIAVQTNFGATASAAIPEPSTLLLVTLAAAATVLRRA